MSHAAVEPCADHLQGQQWRWPIAARHGAGSPLMESKPDHSDLINRPPHAECPLWPLVGTRAYFFTGEKTDQTDITEGKRADSAEMWLPCVDRVWNYAERTSLAGTYARFIHFKKKRGIYNTVFTTYVYASYVYACSLIIIITVLQTVRRHGVYSAAYDTVHYKEKAKCIDSFSRFYTSPLVW